MALQTKCVCRWAGGEGEVTALLDGREILLDGSLTLKLPIDSISHVGVLGGHLLLSAPGCTFELHLGSAEAVMWAKRLAEPLALFGSANPEDIPASSLRAVVRNP